MANLQLDSNGKNITYPSYDAFLNGDPANRLPKVDLSQWDMATTCGVCHVGGGHDEHDRSNMRLSLRTIMDYLVAPTMPAGNPSGMPEINPITSTVWEQYKSDTGADQSHAGMSPWIYPQYNNNDPGQGAMGAPYGWGKKMQMPNPDTLVMMNVSTSQLMMPNVREMDCLFCHLSGYNNVMASVAIQAGSLNVTPMIGAGLMDLFPISPTFQGYEASKVTLVPMTGNYAGMSMVYLNATTMVAKINKVPDSNNCMACHATQTLKDLPEMFGTTGKSSGFLSAAPTIYDPVSARQFGPNGRRMVSYDINSPWLPIDAKSPELSGMDMNNVYARLLNLNGSMMPEAMGPTPANASKYLTDPYFIGGGNSGGMKGGPLFFMNPEDADGREQNSLKRSNMPFPRAEWFKRGDTWQDGQDVHTSFGCAGCHFTGDATHKNQCDPGRGNDNNSGIEDGVPPLNNRQLVTGGELPNGDASAALQMPGLHDTRNTVKRCEFCHITGKDQYGNVISTLGAPNPTTAHANAGLTAKLTQMVDSYPITGAPGGYGGQGIAQDLSTAGTATALHAATSRGDHLDVMDCTVCHVQKTSMVVRDLDATSGSRFPVVLGTDMSKGMMGLFEDPATDPANGGAAMQINQVLTAMGIPANQQYPTDGSAHVIGGQLQPWKPALMWQKNGNYGLPLSIKEVDVNAVIPKDLNAPASAGDAQLFRRKITLNNALVAILWNNVDPNVDANGDGVPGGIMNQEKPSLSGYKDIFTNELLTRNNTAGYDDPIFDPWIMHELKAGMNFGPSGFAPISVGFGNGPYQSAYAPDFSFTGAFKYASVWGGAVIFTEPDQIKAYKDMRTAMTPAKPWNKTELSFIAITPLVTHGVKPTSKYALGKGGCTDCHGTGKDFFDGTMNMTGSAIPADATYNPTSQTTPVDADGNYARVAMIPALDGPSNMMERPLEWIPRVKTYKGDLRTEYEDFNKLGQPRTLKFEKESEERDAGGINAKYTFTTDLERAKILYPYGPEGDGAIYCKVTDDCVANPAKLIDGAAYALYLTTISDKTAFGIGVDPVADFLAAIPASTTAATAITLSAVEAQVNGSGQPVGTSTYVWSYTDGTTEAGLDGKTVFKVFPISTGKTGSISFASTGSKIVTLTVTDEEGKQSNRSAAVTVVAPLTMTVSPGTAKAGVSTGFTFGNLPAGTTKLSVTWGDGGSLSYTTGLALPKNHTYQTIGTKSLKVYAYDSTGKQLGYLLPKVTVTTL